MYAFKLLYTPEGLYYVMAHVVHPSVHPFLSYLPSNMFSLCIVLAYLVRTVFIWFLYNFGILFSTTSSCGGTFFLHVRLLVLELSPLEYILYRHILSGHLLQLYIGFLYNLFFCTKSSCVGIFFLHVKVLVLEFLRVYNAPILALLFKIWLVIVCIFALHWYNKDCY